MQYENQMLCSLTLIYIIKRYPQLYQPILTTTRLNTTGLTKLSHLWYFNQNLQAGILDGFQRQTTEVERNLQQEQLRVLENSLRWFPLYFCFWLSSQ